jgi:hypothetical protein
MNRASGGRRAVAAIWMLVVLAILSAVLAATTWQHLAARRMLDQRHKQLQADWLARAGIELAADRLINSPAEYKEVARAILPSSEVRVTVERDPGLTPLAVFAASSAGLGAAPLGKGILLAASGPMPAGARTTDSYLVTSEARYRTDEPPVVVRLLTGRFRRVVEGNHVRLIRSGRGSTEY